MKPGDIVFARTGATTGKSFLVRDCPPQSVFASYLIRVRPSEKIDSGYLSYFFQTPNYWQQISQSSTGSAQAGVNSTKLKQLKVPLLPIAEQRRIAAILDKADAVRRKRKEAIALTEELLRSAFLDMFGDPIKNPKGWEIVTLKSQVLDLRYGTSEKCSDSKSTNLSLPVLRIPNIIGEEISWNSLKFADLSEKEIKKLVLEPGDLLFVRSNGNPEHIGRCAIYEEDSETALYASYLIRARLKADTSLNSAFIRDVISFPTYRSRLIKEARTTAGNYNINTKGLGGLKLISPPKLEQQKYLELHARLRSRIDSLKQDLRTTDNLFNSLLQRAFRGDL